MKQIVGVHLPKILKHLVSEAVSLFGEVLLREVGAKKFRQIESLRVEMTKLRGDNPEAVYSCLQKHLEKFNQIKPEERLIFARAFTLMLETMNACENAYRTFRTTTSSEIHTDGAHQITYVLTAHPTEARSPQNIAVFHDVQRLLVQILKESSGESLLIGRQRTADLKHLFEIAWRTWIVRHRAPKVSDEAEHIYSTLFRKDVFEELLELLTEKVPVHLYTWVGGDKDGHPGVQEKTLLESLTLSRGHLVKMALLNLDCIEETLSGFQKTEELKKSKKEISSLQNSFRQIRRLQSGDGRRIMRLKKQFVEFANRYQNHIGEKHPSLRRLEQIWKLFPGLVVPLELRESSDVLMSRPKSRLAIERMLAKLASLSAGGDERWYAHGFIISMTKSIEHIQMAATKQFEAFGKIPLPVIPLFEDVQSLKNSPQIVKAYVADKRLKSAAKNYWNQQIELMVGYSDSSKEAGVLFSRWSISQALPALEKVCTRAGLTPIFFHGSGGSVDRGGGSIQDQTAWWPRSALKNYKVTIQGEMVERGFASAEIARSQIEHIAKSVQAGLKNKSHDPHDESLKKFAARVEELYSDAIHSDDFLRVVEQATPYSYLRLLKMGSRPAKRSKQLEVSGLRAIPWILCWTQTRVLFPTWWGVGTAWKELSKTEKNKLQSAFKNQPVFKSYVKALGFTLAKIELGVWRLYLQNSPLDSESADKAYADFKTEHTLACRFFRELTCEKNFTWEKPWLGESIHLRSPMIHPLNVLQIIAKKNKEVDLLRVTATGISSGMLTTG